MRGISRKVCLIFDESDEITNDETQRTRNSLDVFRRCKYKLLATGTTTRNNVAELYGQFEILYNNSVNFMCWCKKVYIEDRITHDIFCEDNTNVGKPFPPRERPASSKTVSVREKSPSSELRNGIRIFTTNMNSPS